MVQVAVIGIGQSPASEQWDKDARALAVEALRAALQDAHVNQVDALYVGDILGGESNQQHDLGLLIADALGMHGLPAFRVESASDSGAAALHAGCLAIAAGQSDRVAVVGVERMTHLAPRAVMQTLASSGDREDQAAYGFSFDSLSALLLRRVMHEFDLMEEDFAWFTLHAHANIPYNPYAMFPRRVALETYFRANKATDFINPLDAARTGDVAAVILSRGDRLNRNRSCAAVVGASNVANNRPSLGRHPGKS